MNSTEPSAEELAELVAVEAELDKRWPETKIEPSLMPQQVQQIPVPQAANSDERQQQILVLMEEIFRDNQLTMDRTLALLGEIEGAAVAMRATLTDP